MQGTYVVGGIWTLYLEMSGRRYEYLCAVSRLRTGLERLEKNVQPGFHEERPQCQCDHWAYEGCVRYRHDSHQSKRSIVLVSRIQKHVKTKMSVERPKATAEETDAHLHPLYHPSSMLSAGEPFPIPHISRHIDFSLGTGSLPSSLSMTFYSGKVPVQSPHA